jgi:DUF971 family protein
MPERLVQIKQMGSRLLHLEWTDGIKQDIDVVELRRQCRCASCIDEWSHKQILKPEQIADTTRPVEVASVGRYAIKVDFSDGHRTGIYTYDLLRSLS